MAMDCSSWAAPGGLSLSRPYLTLQAVTAMRWMSAMR